MGQGPGWQGRQVSWAWKIGRGLDVLAGKTGMEENGIKTKKTNYG